MYCRTTITATWFVVSALIACTVGWAQAPNPNIWALPPGTPTYAPGTPNYAPGTANYAPGTSNYGPSAPNYGPGAPNPNYGQPGTLAPGYGAPQPPPGNTSPTGPVGPPLAAPVGPTPSGTFVGPDLPIADESFAAQPDTPWYSPTQWFGWETWDVSFEIGLNGTEGNSQSLSMQTGGDLTRETESGKLNVEAKYFRTYSDGIESQNNGWFKSRYDWKLGESPWTIYSNTELYYDEFKAFDIRLVLNGGLGYNWIDSDATNFTTRVGAGASREFGGIDDDWEPEANFGIDFEHRLTKVQKLTATVDYYPAFDNFNSYRVVADIGWELVLDAAANLSLKLGILDQYDSTPNGAEPNDLNYTMLMIWKK